MELDNTRETNNNALGKDVPFTKRLSTLFFTCFIITAIVPLSIFGYLAYSKAYQLLYKDIEQKALSILHLRTNLINSYFNEILTQISFQSRLNENVLFLEKLREGLILSKLSPPNFIKSHEWARLRDDYGKSLKNFQEHYQYHDVFLIDIDGNILFTVAEESDLGKNLNSGILSSTRFTAAVQQSLESGDPFFSDFEEYSPSGKIGGFLSDALIDEEGEIIGVIVFQFDINSLNDIMQEDLPIGETYETYLVGTDLKLRSTRHKHSDESSLLETAIDTEQTRLWLAHLKELKINDDKPIEHTSNHGYSGHLPVAHSLQVYPGPDEETVLGSHAGLEVSGVNFCVISEISTEEAFSTLYDFRTAFLTLIFITIIIVIIIGISMAFKISNPLEILVKTTQKVAKGDWKIRAGITGEGTIGRLAQSFNFMLNNLESSQKALLEEKELLSTTILNINDGIITCDIEGNILLVNKIAEELTGWNKSEATGKKIDIVFNIIDEQGKTTNQNPIKTILEEGKPPGPANECSLKSRDGKLHDIAQSAAPIINHEGVTAGLVLVFRDITERKQKEKQLLRQQNLLEGINRIFRESIIKETVNEVGNECLKVAEELTGSQFGFIGSINSKGKFDTTALSDPGWGECRVPETDAVLQINNMEIRGIWGDVIKNGTSLIVNDPPSYPNRVGIPPGHPELNSFLGVPIKPDKKVVGMIALANKPGGYTEEDQRIIEAISVSFAEALLRKETQVELKEHRDHLEKLVEEKTRELKTNWEQTLTLFSGIDDVMYVSDPETYELLYVNEAFKKNWGDEVLGKKCHSVIQSRDTPCPFCTNDIIFGEYKGKTYIWEFQNEVTGSWFRCADKAIKWPDGRMVRFEIASDISEQKQTEQKLAESNEELEQFAYVASHDLQEPLRMVSSYTQLLARRYEDKLDQDAQDFIEFAVDGANRMQQLIQDLLQYSRLNTRGQEFQEVDLLEVFNEAVNNLKISIEENGAKVTNETLPTVFADPSQLVSLFQNLIGNAIKFRRDEIPPRIHISVEEKNNEWLFAVADNGIGIEDQYKERIFVIFQRLLSKDKYPGTGIGLSLCKRIIERHGGRIWIESTYGEGSTFYFTLPFITENL